LQNLTPEFSEFLTQNLPEIIEKLLSETSAYSPRYELRRLLLNQLYALGAWAEETVDLQRLLSVANEETQMGQDLRNLISSPAAKPSQLKIFIVKSMR